jgi:threonine/homoserine/homoserine lactone efflux protein
VRLGWLARRSSGSTSLAAAGPGAPGAWALFGKGLLANAINPKVVMFFLAFLPQFVVAGRDDLAWQMAQLGLTFTLQAAVLFGSLGYFAGHLGQWLNYHAAAGRWLDRVAGTVFLGLGLKLIVDR